MSQINSKELESESTEDRKNPKSKELVLKEG